MWCARHLVGDEPFAVLLPDDLMVGEPGALAQMIEAYNRVGGGVIVAAEEKPLEEVHRYGVIDPGETKGNATEVKGVVEKPKAEDAPSRLTVIGRYILQPEIFRRTRPAGNRRGRRNPAHRCHGQADRPLALPRREDRLHAL